MKALKIVGGILLGVATLVIVAIVILVAVVDLNSYKKQIEELAAKQNVQLKIEGDLGWSFYPSLGIRSGKLTLLPPMENLAAPIAFDSLRVGIQLLPLVMKQEVQASVVDIAGGVLALQSPGSEDLTRIEKLHLTAHHFNLQQQPFGLDMALEMSSEVAGRVTQRITLDSDMQLALDSNLQKVQVIRSHYDITFAGDALPQPATITMDFSGAVDMAQSIADLTAFRLKVDETTLEGTVRAAYGEKPYYQVNLKGDRINLDRYSKKGGVAAEGKKDPDAGKREAPEPLIPAALVLAFPGEYQLSFAQMVVQHMQLSDFSLAAVVGREGVATIKPLKARLYEGELAMEAAVDVRGAQPTVKTKLSLSPLQLEPALKDYLQVEKAFASGDFAVQAEVNTRGLTTEDFLRAMDGNFSFNSKVIALNVDLTSSLDASLLQLLQAKLPALSSAENKTVMSDLAGQGNIQQGVAKPLITAKALCTQFRIEGAYDVPASAVDMQVGITFPSGDTTAACADINPRLKDVAWPVRCQGSLSGDTAKLCAADTKGIQAIVAGMAKKEAGQKINKKLDETLDKKLGKDADAAKQLLKGLFR